MKISLRSMVVGLMALVPVVCCTLAYQAGASRAVMQRPSVVVTVDLEKLFESLNLKADLDGDLTRMAEEAKVEKDKRDKSIADMRADLGNMVDGPQKTALMDSIDEADMELQAWFVITQRNLDYEQSLMWQRLYRAAKKSIASMAQAEGYDLVLVSDANGEVIVDRRSQVPPVQQVKAQIATRRTLYAGDETDITEKLIVRMNNEHGAGN